ncbi:MAG: hypothetical protein ACXAE3_01410 [Candidatus Kariarchaeaceae archaeon]|jgi:hypothetical protein
MSEDKIDETKIAEAKGSLDHVETKQSTSTMKPVFKCGTCGATQDIPGDLLAKMENDEDISASIPNHDDHGRMKISVAG